MINDYGSTEVSHSSRLSVYIFFYIFDVIFSTILIFFLLASNRDCPEAQKITDRGINYYQLCSSFFIRVHGCKFADHVYNFLQEELLHEAMKER